MNTHTYFSCVLWDDCKRWYNHMRHNASFIASNTHSKRERTELPHIQQYNTCMLYVLIDKNLWQSVSAFDSLSITFWTRNTELILLSKRTIMKIFSFVQKWIKFIKYLLFILKTTLNFQPTFLFKIRNDKLMIMIIIIPEISTSSIIKFY